MREVQKPWASDADVDANTFYRHVLETLQSAGVPVLVGGAYAFATYTGIVRDTKDFDVFIRRGDFDRVKKLLSAAGYATELTFPHWLAKAYAGPLFVDLIFNSGNGVTPIDDGWFDHATDAEVLGVRAKVQPVEEMIWSKLFIMERERYDGADVAHLFHACAATLDWRRLVQRVGPNWRVLLAHVVLFGFVYPAERARIPAWVVDELTSGLRDETHSPPPNSPLCRGTLLSREQYLHDVHERGYTDGRLAPYGTMSVEDIAIWTEAIGQRDDAKSAVVVAAGATATAHAETDA